MRGLILCLAFVTAAPASTLFRTPMERHDWKVIRGRAATDSSSEHDGKKSLRVEPAVNGSDAEIRSAPIDLVIGKTYQLTGWVRTRDLTVRDAGRSPIASGAALQMASMPFDVHSASLGGTREWTQLSLRFVATRAQDEILLTMANGGEFKGRAWFEGVNLEEASPGDSWPARDAVRTFGPAYRYPAAGWIYLHIEGKPYERGYQHGYLMAKEIPEYLKRCAFELAGNADKKTWDAYRTTANALFLRGFDAEILEEMRGIADGANAAGARWLDRRMDLIDIVVANTTVEMGELAKAVNTTPTGIENSRFDLPPYAGKGDSPADHCSAFAAIGPATRDGEMVIGHVTWWPQTLAEQTNVMLDIQPEKGHRVMMQSYPGGIESGTDWYQNDAGIVLTETTLRQTPFNVTGTPVAFRARLAIQYSASIDDVVKQLGAHNNGLYTQFAGLVFPGNDSAFLGLAGFLVPQPVFLVAFDGRAQRVVGRGFHQVVAAGIEPVIRIRFGVSRGRHDALIGPAEFRPDHHVVRHGRGRDFGIHRRAIDQRRAVEGFKRELFVDLALVLAVETLPCLIAHRRHIRSVFGSAVRIRQIFQVHVEVFGVVVAPIEAGGAAEPFVLRTSPEPAVTGAQLVHGDFVVPRIADEPFIRSVQPENRAVEIETDPVAPRRQRGIGLRPPDEDHVLVSEHRVGGFEVLVDRNLALLAIAEFPLQEFGHITIRSALRAWCRKQSPRWPDGREYLREDKPAHRPDRAH